MGCAQPAKRKNCTYTHVNVAYALHILYIKCTAIYSNWSKRLSKTEQTAGDKFRGNTCNSPKISINMTFKKWQQKIKRNAKLKHYSISGIITAHYKVLVKKMTNAIKPHQFFSHIEPEHKPLPEFPHHLKRSV